MAGALGESMLVDLRDRILGQGGIPDLPPGWYAESALRSAGGTPFAGDFVVAARPRTADRLEVVVVDVSGKGEQAGTRALLLSGACGGLLTALPPADFLRASNEYLLRQEWEEGFATAIHLSLDLVSGRYEIRSAGHPPAVQLTAGSGRWSVLETEGPVLGLIDDAQFPAGRGRAAATATRCCSTPTAWSRPRGATSASGSTGCSARPSACCAGSFDGRGGAAGRLAGVAERRPGAAAGPPPLSAPAGRPRLGSSGRLVAR